MNLIVENNIKFGVLLAIGDTHGENLQIAPHLLMKYGLDSDEETKAILHVGDGGIGFTTVTGQMVELNHLNDRLKKYNTYLYVIRGNHDDPKYFNNQEFKTENGIDDLSNIVLIPDHTKLVLDINGEVKTIYCNGGAVSIDRILRTPGKSYWWDEEFKCPLGPGLAEIGGDIDIVLCHTRPAGQYPFEKTNVQRWLLKDMSLSVDIDREELAMKRLCDSIKEDNPDGVHFICGHFHFSHTGYDGPHKHQILDIDELIEIR